jgi:dTDP-4-dehydrorhamnose reductase
MKILITGGSGLLGQYLNLRLSKNHQILTTYNSTVRNCSGFPNIQLDLNDYKKVDETFNNFLPDAVIHTAAISSPQKAAMLKPKEVYKINVNDTLNIAEMCKKYEAKLIYTSTDLVYAGYRGSMLKEDAKLIPTSIYAETKLMGEIKIQETFDNYLILRTCLLFGIGLNGSTNFFHKMYFDFKNRKKIKLFKDQFRTPLSLFDAARMIDELLESAVTKEVINFGGSERVSRAELGALLCEAANFDKSLIEPISMAEITDYPQVADVSLNIDKLTSLGIKPNSIKDSILKILETQKEFKV